MQDRTAHRQRRAKRRAQRAIIRQRSAPNRLIATCRRPRSLTTIGIAAGVDRTTASGCASGLRAVAKRRGVTPAETGRTRRTVNGGRARKTHTVARYTLGQVCTLLDAYKPRKPEYVAAVALIAAFAANS